MSLKRKSASNKGTTGTTNIIDSFYFRYGFRVFRAQRWGETTKKWFADVAIGFADVSF